MEELRQDLYKAIDIYGLDYNKIIEADNKLHEEVIKEMRGRLCLEK